MTPPTDPREPPLWLKRLEQFTGIVLGLVLAALAWILVVSFQPTWLRLGSEAAEMIAVIALLTLALTLVTVVALLHTRSR
jgi:hypothetical protein